jgi:hypothetical protein
VAAIGTATGALPVLANVPYNHNETVVRSPDGL